MQHRLSIVIGLKIPYFHVLSVRLWSFSRAVIISPYRTAATFQGQHTLEFESKHVSVGVETI